MRFWKDLFVDDSSVNPVRSLEAHELEDWFDEVFLSPAIHRLNQEAVVEDVCDQGREWRVKYQGSLWHARSIGGQLQLYSGDIVYVVARRGNVLFVKAP